METRGNCLPCRYYFPLRMRWSRKKSLQKWELLLRSFEEKPWEKIEKENWVDRWLHRTCGAKIIQYLLQEMKLVFKQVHLYMCRLIQYISISCQFYFSNQIKSEHGEIKLKRSNNCIFLRLKIYWNRQVFDLIHASGIWMKSEKFRHQASSSKF